MTSNLFALNQKLCDMCQELQLLYLDLEVCVVMIISLVIVQNFSGVFLTVTSSILEVTSPKILPNAFVPAFKCYIYFLSPLDITLQDLPCVPGTCTKLLPDVGNCLCIRAHNNFSLVNCFLPSFTTFLSYLCYSKCCRI